MNIDVATMLGGAAMGAVAGWYARAYFGRGMSAWRKLRGGWQGES